ncbi:MAG: hypothetical protein ABSF67_18075 [Roseiarcus sp.]|jgi:hypothetical protein
MRSALFLSLTCSPSAPLRRMESVGVIVAERRPGAARWCVRLV